MLTSVELEQIMYRLGLSTRARAVIRAAQAGSLQRVRSGGRGTRPANPGTNLVLGKVELAGMLDLTYDPDVLAFWRAPHPMELAYTVAYLVVRRDGAAYEDWATEEELGRAAVVAPGRFVRTAAGQWRCPAAEAVAAANGLGYILRSSANIGPCLQANLDHLDTYFRSVQPIPRIDKKLETTLRDAVQCTPGITLSDLRWEVEQRLGAAVASPDRVAHAINILVLRQWLYVDLRAERLTEPTQAHVYADKATAQAFFCISGLPGQSLQALSAITAEGRELLLNARSKDLAVANERFRLISPHGDVELPRSTRCRLAKQYRESECKYGAGYIGLLPAHVRCGRREPRYDTRTTTLVEKYVTECYASPSHFGQPDRRAAYDGLLTACTREQVPCPSYQFFCSAVRARATLMRAWLAGA